MNISALASASGYAEVMAAGNEEELSAVLEKAVISKTGPVLIEVRCACGSRPDLGRPTTTPIQNRDALMDYIR